MAKGDRLTLDNVNQMVEGIRCDADGNELTRDSMCVSAKDMMRVCGDCGLVVLSAGTIAGVDVWVVRRDHEACKLAQISPPGRNSQTIQGETKEDTVYGSCMVLKRENGRIRSLSKAAIKAIMSTAGLYQFTSEGGRMSLCLRGLELM